MICLQESSMTLQYFDMIDASKSILNSQLEGESSSCKSEGAIAEYDSMKINDSHVCLICNRKFRQKSSYQNHLRIHEKNETSVHSCNICYKSFAVPARLTRHYRTHTGEKPYKCEYCTKSFSVKENLSVHRRIHTKERPYRCDVCHSGFEHSGKLHRHMRIHTGERPHKCPTCDKTFIQSGQLVIHMRTHTGEKPYVCQLCGKGFTCSKQLKVHTRTHTGEKPYSCEICGKSFGYNHVLKLHQISHYGEKFYKCIICQKSFKSKKLMEMHIKSPSNCKLYDAATLKPITSQTIDIVNEIIPYDISHPKFTIEETSNKKQTESKPFTENPVFYKINNSNEKIEQLIYRKSHRLSNNSTKTLTKNLASDVIVPDERNDSKSLSLLCRYSSMALTEYNAYTHKMNQYAFVAPIIPSTIQYPYPKLGETMLPRPSEQDTLSEDNNFKNLSKEVILPLRKRCKIILESFSSEKLGLETPKRFNSVIMFAKTDKTN